MVVHACDPAPMAAPACDPALEAKTNGSLRLVSQASLLCEPQVLVRDLISAHKVDSSRSLASTGMNTRECVHMWNKHKDVNIYLHTNNNNNNR